MNNNETTTPVGEGENRKLTGESDRGGGYLGRGVQIVSFILGAFSGFLKGIAPPDETHPQFTVGITSFGALVLFLIILALARYRNKPLWLLAAILLLATFLGFAFKYQDDRSRLTILWPPNAPEQKLYAVGETLTKRAEEEKRKDTSLTPTRLVSGFGGISEELNIDARTKVWTEESIRASRRTLLRDYLVLVLSLCGAIFCLTEGILLSGAQPAMSTVQAGAPAISPPAEAGDAPSRGAPAS